MYIIARMMICLLFLKLNKIQDETPRKAIDGLECKEIITSTLKIMLNTVVIKKYQIILFI